MQSRKLKTDVAIIGAGTAGMFALREVRRAGKSFVLIDGGPLGTTCARVGCMPSKVALHTAGLWADRLALPARGGSGIEHLRLDHRAAWAALRAQRDGFSGGVASRTESVAGENLLRGKARFLAPNRLEVNGPDLHCEVEAGAVVIATGSRPVWPDWLSPVAERVVTTDELFELETLPQRVGILGLGTIGLEMGLALARLGVQVTGVEMARQIGGIHDPDVAARALKRFGNEMDMWLGERASLSLTQNGVRMQTAQHDTEVDLILAALGRGPNAGGLGLAELGFAVDAHGVPLFDPATMQLGDAPVFIAGDANADRPLMHEAADEGAIAGYNAARGLRLRFRRKTPLAIAFTDPDIAFVGVQPGSLDGHNLLVGVAGGDGNGRARILDAADSLLHVYAAADTGQLLGATVLARGGEHLAHLLAWAIQRGETAQSLLQMPFYHPVVEEMLQSALQDIVRHFVTDDDVPPSLMMEAA